MTLAPRAACLSPLKLIVRPGDREIELTQEAVVGRHATADIRLEDPQISRQHCRLTFSNGAWWVIDLNSRNGVWVNGQHVREAAIYDGDCLRVGLSEITIVCGSPRLTTAIPSKVD